MLTWSENILVFLAMLKVRTGTGADAVVGSDFNLALKKYRPTKNVTNPFHNYGVESVAVTQPHDIIGWMRRLDTYTRCLMFMNDSSHVCFKVV